MNVLQGGWHDHEWLDDALTWAIDLGEVVDCPDVDDGCACGDYHCQVFRTRPRSGAFAKGAN